MSSQLDFGLLIQSLLADPLFRTSIIVIISTFIVSISTSALFVFYFFSLAKNGCHEDNAMSSSKDIFVLLVPLAFSRAGGSASASAPSGLGRISFLSVRVLQHWAILIDKTVYEVTSAPTNAAVGERVYVMRVIALQEWRESYSSYEVEKIFVGRAKYPRLIMNWMLKRRATQIWESFNKKQYNFFDRNCQNFALLFFRLVRDNNVSEEDRRLWNRFPIPLSRQSFRLIWILGSGILVEISLYLVFTLLDTRMFIRIIGHLGLGGGIIKMITDIVREAGWLEGKDDQWLLEVMKEKAKTKWYHFKRFKDILRDVDKRM